MRKLVLDANTFYQQCFALARQVFDSGFRPDYLLMLMRGGAPVGIVMHEYFRHHGLELDHESIRAISYTAVGKRNGIVFKGIDVLQKLEGKHVLVVDDIFDSGKTVEALSSHLLSTTKTKIAVLYHKPSANQTRMKPDYVLQATDAWVVFPHELEGLSAAAASRRAGSRI